MTYSMLMLGKKIDSSTHAKTKQSIIKQTFSHNTHLIIANDDNKEAPTTTRPCTSYRLEKDKIVKRKGTHNSFGES